MDLDIETTKIASPFTVPRGFHDRLRDSLRSIPDDMTAVRPPRRRGRHLLPVMFGAVATVAVMIMALPVLTDRDPMTVITPGETTADSFYTTMSDTEIDNYLALTENDVFLDY